MQFSLLEQIDYLTFDSILLEILNQSNLLSYFEASIWVIEQMFSFNGVQNVLLLKGMTEGEMGRIFLK